MSRASEVWSQRLKQKVQKQRVRFHLSLWLIALLLVAGGAGIAWWLFTRQAPVALLVVAFDQLALPDKQATVIAQVEPVANPRKPETARQAPSIASAELAEQPLVFDEDLPLQPTGKSLVKSTTGKAGWAEAKLSFSKSAPIAPYLVRLLGGEARPDAQDRAQVFFVPAETHLLLVDVKGTLTAPAAATWTMPLPTIEPVDGASSTLKELAGLGYQPVYLALAGNKPSDYRQVRRWIVSRRHELPAGPTLGTLQLADAAPDEQRDQTLAALLKQYPNCHAIVAWPTFAGRLQELGVKDVVVIGKDAPAGIRHAETWRGVGKLLAKEKTARDAKESKNKNAK